MEKSNINPEIFQQLLDSAANAASKGQSQFFTNAEFGKPLAIPLPEYRPTLVDLQCGGGHLLEASRNKTTNTLLGCDIDPCKGKRDGIAVQRIVADVTRLYSLLVDVNWRFDLGVFNPPWDLWWYRDRLSGLLESKVPAVRAAFAAHDGRTTKETIDSTVATMLMALDRFSKCGEGLLIANNATLQRLILDPAAPHGVLAQHVWAHLAIKGNPMTGIDDHAFSEDGSFQTGVIYFAQGHTSGCRFQRVVQTSEELKQALDEMKECRWRNRQGPELMSYSQESPDTVPLWRAIHDEWKAGQKPGRTDFNLWLGDDGTIRTHLSLFDQKSSRILRDEAARLNRLAGKRPMQLVMQRSQREDLLRAAGIGHSTVWRVCPQLQSAVEQAVQEYHACRAPLYPLPELQRLGYLDEEDFITCQKDLTLDRRVIFRAGERYPLASLSVTVTREGFKPNLEGEPELIEYTGQELALIAKDEDAQERVFMEARLRDPKVSVSKRIDFTLQDLAEHFIIPEVNDIAAVDPEGFKNNLAKLEALEALLAPKT